MRVQQKEEHEWVAETGIFYQGAHELMKTVPLQTERHPHPGHPILLALVFLNFSPGCNVYPPLPLSLSMYPLRVGLAHFCWEQGSLGKQGVREEVTSS